MITTPVDYQNLLWQIQNENFPTQAILLPKAEQIYNIDLHTRTIEAPEILSAERDHYAETIYFKMDRYFDNMDLTTTVGIVQYINKNARHQDGTKDLGHIWPIPFYDVTTLNSEEPNKILFPWCINGPATKAAGPIEFSFRFYLLDNLIDSQGAVIGKQYVYNLNTMSATSKILHGMNVITDENENFQIADSDLFDVYQRINQIATAANLTWIDAF